MKSGNFIEKKEAKDSSTDGLGIADGRDVVYLRCSKEFFSRGEVGWGLTTECVVNCLLAQSTSYRFMILICCCA